MVLYRASGRAPLPLHAYIPHSFPYIFLRLLPRPLHRKAKKKILKNDIHHELNEREFSVKVINENKEHLRELGLIEDGTQIGKRISIKMKYIDPVYAVSNEPRLIEQPEFQIFRSKYEDEIKIVSDVVSERYEHT